MFGASEDTPHPFSLLSVSPVETLSQDSYGYGPSTATSSYENKEYHLPAVGQLQLPAMTTLCQPGGFLQGQV